MVLRHRLLRFQAPALCLRKSIVNPTIHHLNYQLPLQHLDIVAPRAIRKEVDGNMDMAPRAIRKEADGIMDMALHRMVDEGTVTDTVNVTIL